MADVGTKSGKKNRKFGRKKDKPAQKRYTAKKRWIKNKALRIVKHLKKFPKCKPINLSAGVVEYIEKLGYKV